MMNQSEQHLTNCKLAKVSYAILSEFPREEHKRHRIAVILINCILLLSTIMLNGISIITIRKSSQLKNKVCYFVILIQSVVDLSVGVVGIPPFIYYLIFPFLDTIDCSFMILVIRGTQLTIGLSIVTLSATTMERYIGVLHPYSYTTKVTKKRLLIYVCGSSLAVFGVVAYSMFYRQITRIAFTAMIFVFFAFTGFVYTRIYLVVRKLKSSEKERRPAGEGGNQNSLSKKVIREIRHARSCFLIVVCFALILIPLTLSPVFLTVGSAEYAVIFDWLHTLVISNSTINSVLYFWSKVLLRKEALKILKPCSF